MVLNIKPSLAPVKVSILPLIKKRHREKAQGIYRDLKEKWMVSYDETGSIGKRYRRGDAIGIPYAITVDDDTIEKNILTVRNRDTMQQDQISLCELQDYLSERL